LIGGSSPAASRIEVHEMAIVDGVTKTRPVEKGPEIKPGQKIEFKPGSYRILLFGLKQPLNLGQKVKGTLQFEKAGSVEIVYNVEENPEALKGAAGMGGHRGH
jgi:copper(I)-binding protein